MLITEKGGALRIADAKGVLAAEPVQGVPAVWSKGQGGLLDVAVHPDYAKNGWIYLSYSDPGENDSAMTAVVRAKLKGNALVEVQHVVQGAGRDVPDGQRALRHRASCSTARATCSSRSASAASSSTRRT